MVADIQSAPSCVPANKHLVEKVYSVIKKEAEELAALAVREIHDRSHFRSQKALCRIKLSYG